MSAATAPHLNHRVRWTYDDLGNGTPHCLECDVPVPPVMRTCPQCAATFDGTTIGATLEARILCADCSSNLGRELATRRRRTTIACVICGTEKEVWDRKTQQSRTCSPACRQKLWRQSEQDRQR